MNVDITDILNGFCLPFIFPSCSKILAKLNGKLGCLKTTPCLSVDFCNDELIEDTQGRGERWVSCREDGKIGNPDR